MPSVDCLQFEIKPQPEGGLCIKHFRTDLINIVLYVIFKLCLERWTGNSWDVPSGLEEVLASGGGV